ncbi:enoyl-CoA hydratase-related protein [Marinobacter sp.]|uniref:enoyl-CoA hydratase-related protein n=1 Tax=Marinobacter sp. TaxID=50741 RepID=UPI00384E517E
MRVDNQDSIAILRLDESPGNLWNEEILTEFNSQIMALARDSANRCLIITGKRNDDSPAERNENDAPESCFSLGLDPLALETEDPLTGANLSRLFAQAYGNLRRFPGVTIAAINGDAHNEGLSLALNCDFRLTSSLAVFRFSAGSQGLLPFGGSTQLLPRLVGEPWAKRMILMETPVSAEQALGIGLVDELTEPAEIINTAMVWAQALCRQTPMASRAGKQLIEHARMRPLETGFAAEREWQVQIMEGEDYRNV